MGAYFFFVRAQLLGLAEAFDSTYEGSMGAGRGARDAKALASLFLVFAIQHALFIGARIGVFLVTSVLCCGCPCGDDSDV